MTRVVFSTNFHRSTERIPAKQDTKLARLLELLQQNPYHPKLHTKVLTGDLSGFYSFRITRDWRVFFQFLDPGTIQLLRVVHRRDAYRA